MSYLHLNCVLVTSQLILSCLICLSSVLFKSQLILSCLLCLNCVSVDTQQSVSIVSADSQLPVMSQHRLSKSQLPFLSIPILTKLCLISKCVLVTSQHHLSCVSAPSQQSQHCVSTNSAKDSYRNGRNTPKMPI